MRTPIPTHPADTSRFGGYVLTFTGNWFYPLDPRPEDVHREDMAQGLSLKSRWSGQCNLFYPILSHCLAVADIGAYLAERDGKPRWFVDLVRKLGLVHDGNEAYFPDVPGPIKRYIEGWKEKENKIQAAIHARLGLPEHHTEAEVYVKWADLMMLAIEHEQLFSRLTTPAELYNNYNEKTLWPGYPMVPEEVRQVAAPYAPSRSLWRRILVFWQSERREFLKRLEASFGKEI